MKSKPNTKKVTEWTLIYNNTQEFNASDQSIISLEQVSDIGCFDIHIHQLTWKERHAILNPPLQLFVALQTSSVTQPARHTYCLHIYIQPWHLPTKSVEFHYNDLTTKSNVRLIGQELHETEQPQFVGKNYERLQAGAQGSSLFGKGLDLIYTYPKKPRRLISPVTLPTAKRGSGVNMWQVVNDTALMYNWKVT